MKYTSEKFKDGRYNLIGKKYHRLTVIAYDGKDKFGKSKWICECNCDDTTKKSILGINLTSGKTKSCGCIQMENRSKGSSTNNPNYKHGHTVNKQTSDEFRTWTNMIARCTNKKNPNYHHYGGRNILICKEWLDSFETFFRDMGKKPSPKHSIDRIDVDGNYEPDNCRWATDLEQSRNKRLSSRNNSGFNGVHWKEDRCKYGAQISIDNKTVHLGYFDLLEDAVKARELGENKYWN